MKERAILGHIDCPTCGTAGGMRVTHDKNGEPFGYCEAECGQQLRVGGDRRRVAAFVARHAWATKAAEPVTVTEQKPVEKAEAKPVTVTEEKPAAKPAKPRSAFDDALRLLGGAA